MSQTIVQAQVLVTIHPAPQRHHEKMNDTTQMEQKIIKLTEENTILKAENVNMNKDNIELKAVIVKLKIQIEEMQNCCELANRCKQHVEELGGSIG